MDCGCDDDEEYTPQPRGAQGVMGFQGNPARGYQGPAGFQGTDVQGRGIQGDVGLQGPLTIGERGFQGAQGNETYGLPGFQGIDGTPGMDDWRGVQGSRGPQGYDGIKQLGPQGIDGTKPVVGKRGDVGFQGSYTYGPQGPQGFTQWETVRFESSWQLNVFNLIAMKLPPSGIPPVFNGAAFYVYPLIPGSRHYLSAAFQITVQSPTAPVYIALQNTGVLLTDTIHKFTPCRNTPQHVLFQTFIDVPVSPSYDISIMYWSDQDNVPFEFRDINNISIPLY